MSLVIKNGHTGAQLITAERERHHTEEGWTIERDNTTHWRGALALAAACYASPVDVFSRDEDTTESQGFSFLRMWPFGINWFKTNRVNPNIDDRIRDLIKAGALCAAEIDRLIYHEEILAVANKK